MPAIAAVKPGEERRRGAENLRRRQRPLAHCRRQHPRHVLGHALGPLIHRVGYQQAGHAPERRQGALSAKANLLQVEAGVVVVGRGLDGVVLRLIGLNDDPPTQQATPRPPRHLGQHLEDALAGVIVGQAEGNIGRDDPHQRHKRQV